MMLIALHSNHLLIAHRVIGSLLNCNSPTHQGGFHD
jgi:hypothetical protein